MAIRRTIQPPLGEYLSVNWGSGTWSVNLLVGLSIVYTLWSTGNK